LPVRDLSERSKWTKISLVEGEQKLFLEKRGVIGPSLNRDYFVIQC